MTKIVKKVWISSFRAAEILDISRDTLVKHLDSGIINGHRTSETGWWRVDFESLCAYKEHLTKGGSIEEWKEVRRRETEGQ